MLFGQRFEPSALASASVMATPANTSAVYANRRRRIAHARHLDRSLLVHQIDGPTLRRSADMSRQPALAPVALANEPLHVDLRFHLHLIERDRNHRPMWFFFRESVALCEPWVMTSWNVSFLAERSFRYGVLTRISLTVHSLCRRMQRYSVFVHLLRQGGARDRRTTRRRARERSLNTNNFGDL